jgi:transposase
VILTAADADTAIAVDVLPGQAHDAPHLHRMLDATAERVPVIDEVVADRGFDGDKLRGGCIDRGVCPVIPNKKNRADPWPFDQLAYRRRNEVERLFAKLKQHRRVATRYDKLKATFLGMLHLTLGFIRLRASRNVNRP